MTDISDYIETPGDSNRDSVNELEIDGYYDDAINGTDADDQEIDDEWYLDYLDPSDDLAVLVDISLPNEPTDNDPDWIAAVVDQEIAA